MVNQIDEDLKLALKNQDKFTLGVLRMLKSEFITESRKGTVHDLTDEEALKVIKHQVKVKKDSIKEYTEYNRLDVVETLNKEIDVLNKYLPKEMTSEEIDKIIDDVFMELNPTSMKDMGAVMREVTLKISNADMSVVSKKIKDRLS